MTPDIRGPRIKGKKSRLVWAAEVAQLIEHLTAGSCDGGFVSSIKIKLQKGDKLD
jgi:hypothetical protein